MTVKSTAIHVAGMPRDEGDESQWPEYEYRSFPFSRRLPHGREKEDTAGAGVFSKRSSMACLRDWKEQRGKEGRGKAGSRGGAKQEAVGANGIS